MKDNAKLGTNGKEQKPEGPTFNVNSIYIKDVSFESPNAPSIFNMDWQPKVDFDLQMSSEAVDEAQGLYEVVLHLTVTVKLKEDTTGFLTEVQQAGIFMLQGFEPDVIKQVLSTACPTVLFPYAREAVSSLVQRGGFPQLILPPINFEAMYAHHLSQGSEENKSTEMAQK